MRKGIRGVHLRYWRVGNRLVASKDALNEFFENLAAADASPEPVAQAVSIPRARGRAPLQRERSIAAAEKHFGIGQVAK